MSLAVRARTGLLHTVMTVSLVSCQLSPLPANLRKLFPACCKLPGSHSYVDVVFLLLECEVMSPSVLFLILSDHCLVSKHWKWNTQTHNVISQKKGYDISRTSLNIVSRTLIITANYAMGLVECLITSWSPYNIDVYMSYRWVSFWWKVTWQWHTRRASHDLVTLNRSMWHHNAIIQCASSNGLTAIR